MKSEDKIMLNDLNKLNNLADKAISDDELEQVSGGAGLQKKCPYCQNLIPMMATVCPDCNTPLV